VIFAALLFCIYDGIDYVVFNLHQHLNHHQAVASPDTPQKAVDPPPDINPWILIRNESEGFLSIALATAAIALIERRRIRVYGIGPRRMPDFLPGLMSGIIALSLLVGGLYAAHVLVFDGRALHGSAIYSFALRWYFGFLMVAFQEEYLLRGYFLYTLNRGLFGAGEKLSPAHARRTSFWMAAILTSIVFASLHLGNHGENAFGILGVFSLGMVRCYARWRTGSLWFAIGFHAAWDWTQSFLWGVPDSGLLCVGRFFKTHALGNHLLSGGLAGPEGSLLLFPTLIVLAVLIRTTTKEGSQPPFDIPVRN
jgi:membrane protease YdiL (CAAX protease family)